MSVGEGLGLAQRGWGFLPSVQSLKETREMLMEPPHPYLILIPCCSLMLPHLVRSKEA